ncbi:hypothetical protein M8J77_014828 [Diaphorina citri]|nr:hypothetical protein M8J77_014828 [Diaphorina citri]
MPVDKTFQSKEGLISQYEKVFTGIGKFPGKPYSIRLKENAVPVNQPPRRVAKILFDQLRSKLDELERNKIIVKVSEPNEWCHALVIREKPNKDLRICLDPRDLNRYVVKDSHYIPTQEDILSDMSNKQIFSVLDMTSSFHQIVLDKESTDLCCFATPFGRYKYLRCPFGISTIAEVCQRKNHELFGDIEGVKVYIDDIYIAAATEEEHDVILKQVMERASQAGVTMNKDKIQFKKNKVTILGYLVSKNGTQIDPQRTEAISKMKTPTDKTELLQFLGMVKYFARFIPNISDITSPLRELTKKDVHWDWKDEHEIAVKRLKDLLVSAPILCHYDSKLDTTIQTDASKDGLGSCLLQNDRVVAYASRSLTETEKRYAQIEKELLAIVFACEKFHYYIYGKKTKIHTDHKPLVTIVKKNIDKISPRMQRMILKLIAYELEVEYLPGTQMYIADALSRNFIASSKEENSDCDMYIHELSPCYPASQEKLQMVLEATLKDPDILQVIRLVQNNSWPNSGKQLNENVKMFFRIKDTLTTIDGLLFKDNKIVIPRNLQTHMLNLFHESHLGMSKIKAKARECGYWPNMNENIEDFIRKCDICQKYSNENPKMPLISHEVPTRAWEKLGTDVMEYNGINYLVVYDYFSKWIEVKRLRNKDSVELIDKFMQIFSYHGAPDFVVSDNMPFSSRMFQKFFDEWNIRSITSSPRYPRGNGLSEKAVNIAKDIC